MIIPACDKVIRCANFIKHLNRVDQNQTTEDIKKTIWKSHIYQQTSMHQKKCSGVKNMARRLLAGKQLCIEVYRRCRLTAGAPKMLF